MENLGCYTSKVKKKINYKTLHHWKNIKNIFKLKIILNA